MHPPPLTGAETDRKRSDWDMGWRWAKGTDLLGYWIASAAHRLQWIHPERPEADADAAGGRQGETGERDLATVTDVALIGCGGGGWRWRMNLLNSLNRFNSLSVLGMPG